jgi:hypothetical protein
VYSLGVVAFELFLGRPPFWAKSSAEIMGMHISLPPTTPSLLWPQIPPTLERLVLAMLHKVPGERPSIHEIEATLSAVRVALQAPSQGALATVTMTTPRTAAVLAGRPRGAPWRGRWRVIVPAVGAGAALLALAAPGWLRGRASARVVEAPRVAEVTLPAAAPPAPAAALPAPTPAPTAPTSAPPAPSPAVVRVTTSPARPARKASPQRTRRSPPRHAPQREDAPSGDEALDPFSGHR